jgi:iron complex transport system substrate-binding protein
LPGDATSGQEIDARFPVTVPDGFGGELTVAAPPRRIVSLAPKNTELLFDIGAGGLLAGRTSYCNHPPEALERPEVGGFSSNTISMEVLLSLKPDLVLLAGNIHRSTAEELARFGIPMLSLEGDSLDELFADMDVLGRITGNVDQAKALAGQMQVRIAQVTQRVGDIPAHERVRVYYQVWDEPVSAAGPTSYIGELIELAGGRNIIEETAERYLRISEEIVLDRNPDVILSAAMASQPIRAEDFLDRGTWREVRAIREGRVHILDGDLLSRCSPRIVDALEQIAPLLYPDRFPSEQTDDRPHPASADPASPSTDPPGGSS